MAEATQAKAAVPAELTGRSPKKKKSKPTNCLQSNKRIRRKDWYYRNGKFFANKQCFRLWQAQEEEKAVKAKADAAAKAEADAKAAEEAKAAARAKPTAEETTG